MATGAIPAAAKTDADKRAYCCRAVERLRLWHNEQGRRLALPKFRCFFRDTYWPRFRAAAHRLNGLRDPAMSYELGSARQTELEAVGFAAAHDTHWDSLIDPVRIVPLGSPAPELPDPTEDLQPPNYTKVDTLGWLAETEDRVTYTAVDRKEDCYLYRDFGLNHFDADFHHLFTVHPTSGVSDGFVDVWALSSIIGTIDDTYAQNANRISFENWRPGGGHKFYLLETDAGNQDYCLNPYTYTCGTTYYCALVRDDSIKLLSGPVHSDAARTNLLGTPTLTLANQRDYQYGYPIMSSGEGIKPEMTCTGWNENYDLQEAVGVGGRIIGSSVIGSPIIGEGVVL